MCPFGDKKDFPCSCDGKFGFFIVGSSCAICPLSSFAKLEIELELSNTLYSDVWLGIKKHILVFNIYCYSLIC